jgi:2-succinyl-5-enolpyruvyl-6-hydroxy-3-cyclohexene-1-carboxylate synthase
MTDMPETGTATFCATLVDEWVRCGVSDAVVAPGSRSTPLALALAGDERLRIHVHHDERSAAFIALGLGLATGRPAPVLTTSGTAAVEMHPAVVEAHHSRVPMIVCTADRPPELREVGAPQTVDQNRLYGHAVRWFVDPGVPDPTSAHMWRSLAARSVVEAIGRPAGPVQLNLPFRDPLVGRPGVLPRARVDNAWHRAVVTSSPGDEASVAGLVDVVSGRRGVILAGHVPGGLDPAAVHGLARALGWPVLADPRSGCRVPEATTVSHADALLRVPSWAHAHRPDVVLQLGQPASSKVLGQWVGASGATVVAVDADGWWFDADRIVEMVLQVDPSMLAAQLSPRVHAVAPEWLDSWIDADRRSAEALERVVSSESGPTEPGVAREVLAVVPDGGTLVVASSMPVRDVEWYGAPRTDVRVLSNRGANGIDGVTSTAVGVALSGAPTVVLLGGVAFLHDTNGLLGLSGRDADLVVVVVDNDGGGIFSFLPQAGLIDADRFEQLFGTPHGVDVTAIAAAHGVPATVADTAEEVGDVVRKGGPALVVARTERQANVALHDAIHDAVAAEIA